MGADSKTREYLIGKATGLISSVKGQYKTLSSQWEELEEEISLDKQAEEVLEQIAQQGAERLTPLTIAGLQAIYGSNYRFRRDGKNILIGDGYVETNLKSGRGCGLVDIIAIILRFLALAQGKGGPLKTLALDEPLRMVDRNTAIKASEFLAYLSKRLKMNILMITHNLDLAESADTVYFVKRVKGISKYERRL